MSRPQANRMYYIVHDFQINNTHMVSTTSLEILNEDPTKP